MAGQTTLAEFLKTAWQTGVIGYEVDFQKRIVVYSGSHDQTYSESSPEAEIGTITPE